MVDLLGVINAVVAGIQLGGFYAAVALGIGALRSPMGPARQ